MKQAINIKSAIDKGEYPLWPQWGEKEERNLIAALDAGQWGTLGDYVLAFSKRFADYIGVKHAIAMNTGTQALELMLRGAGIGRGDEVIVPPYTFAATISAVAYVGAVPVFADIDLNTGCISADKVGSHITERTKAILCVHFAGRPCDMDALKHVAKEHNIYLLEDAAHAHGSEWQGKRCGSLGDAAAFSFQSSKALTSGEGGMITTNNEEIFARSWQYHNSGRSLESTAILIGGTVLMGTNGRMAEWEAAILDAQLDRLEEQSSLRCANAKYLSEKLREIPSVILPMMDERTTVWNGYLYTFRWEDEKKNRDALMHSLREANIPCSEGYPLVSNMEFLRDSTFEKSTGRRFSSKTMLSSAEKMSKTSVWIPGNVLLADKDAMNKIARTISQASKS